MNIFGSHPNWATCQLSGPGKLFKKLCLSFFLGKIVPVPWGSVQTKRLFLQCRKHLVCSVWQIENVA